jgi:hypothetical protein
MKKHTFKTDQPDVLAAKINEFLKTTDMNAARTALRIARDLLDYRSNIESAEMLSTRLLKLQKDRAGLGNHHR